MISIPWRWDRNHRNMPKSQPVMCAFTFSASMFLKKSKVTSRLEGHGNGAEQELGKRPVGQLALMYALLTKKKPDRGRARPDADPGRDRLQGLRIALQFGANFECDRGWCGP